MLSVLAWIRQFIRELRRRRVIRVVVVYCGTGFVALEATGLLSQALELPEWMLSAVTVLLIAGFPIAVGLAWAYNITEEGLIRIDEGSEGEAVEAAHQGKPFTSNAVIIGLLIVAIGLLIYRPVRRPPQDTPSEQVKAGGASTANTTSAADSALANVDPASVAVLPFTYLAAEDSSDYLSIGMTDEILTRLSQIDELSVRGRTSVMQYQETDKTIPEIGRELEVAHVVEGSIQQFGDKLEIQVQLVDARKDEHLWSGNYEGAFKNVLDLQNQVAEDVSDQLPGALGIEDQGQFTGAPEIAPKAYRLYLQARELRFVETGESLIKAARLLDRSLAIDSTYAPAWALLSTTALMTRVRARELPSQRDPDSLARVAALRAMQIDSTSAEVRVAMGVVRQVIDGNFPAAGPHFQRAVELNPNLANAHREYGNYLTRMGRFELGYPYLRKAVRLDPASDVAYSSVISNRLWSGHYEEAKRYERQQEALRSGKDGYAGLWAAYVAQGSTQVARERFAEEIKAAPERWQAAKFVGYSLAGRPDSAREVARRLLPEIDEAATPFRMGVLAYLGRMEEAVALLPQLDRTWGYIFFRVRPFFRPLRGHPIIEKRIRDLGLDEASIEKTIERLDPDPPDVSDTQSPISEGSASAAPAGDEV